MAKRPKVKAEYEEFVFGGKRKGFFAWADIRPVLSSKRFQDKIFRRASIIQIPDPDRFYQRKKTALARVESVGDTAAETLMAYVDAFPDFAGLHPFYRELVATLVDVDKTRQDLARLQGAAKKIKEVCREGMRQMKVTGKLEFLEKKRREVYGRVGSIAKDIAGPLKRLEVVRQELTQLPTLDPTAPTVIIAGVPNVGKSALTTRMSSAKPEIAPYPFTTQGIIVGHVPMGRKTVQFIDTPGILDRPAEERNAIEQRALAAVNHVGDVILFIFDPTPGASQPMAAQERLLAEVRTLFGKKLVVEVENKVDLVKTESARIKISAATGEGVKMLSKHIASVMPEHGKRPKWAVEEE